MRACVGRSSRSRRLPRRAARRSAFPRADREVAPIVSDSFSTEDARDRVGEAEEVMRLRRGQAGDVGRRHRRGRRLLHRPPVADGRTARAGAGGGHRPRDPRPAGPAGPARKSRQCRGAGSACPTTPLPAASFDRIFLVHMYHEVTVALCLPVAPARRAEARWRGDRGRCRPAARRHGMPPALLNCEFAAVGLDRAVEPLAGQRRLFRGIRASPAAARARRDQTCALQSGCGLEQAHPAQAAAFRAGENQMIEDLQVDRFARPRPGGASPGNRVRSGSASPLG